MSPISFRHLATLLFCFGACLSSGCNAKQSDPKSEAPPTAIVQPDADPNLVHVDHPDQFTLVAATDYAAASSIQVTGTVNPDISRTIPVISIASGRVVEVHARIGDYVKKGQLLMDVQSTDVSGAFSSYLKAVNDERLAKVQFERAKLLNDKGAIPNSQVEIAQNAEDDAKAALTASEEQLRVLGVDKDHPAATVKVYAPASGFIIAQNVTNAAAAGVTFAGSSNAFTIADLSHVWIICDVYENDLPTVHLGQKADIRLNAYPDRVLTGVISDIGAVLDPQIRTAKVRIQVENPNTLMRIGMFATVTIHGKNSQTHVQVPATAVLHLHDRDWVYTPVGDGKFRRVPVRGGASLPGNMQEIISGLNAGQQVVTNALALQNTADQ
ncbi:efflux RND transporter periplasmic adaptor subunit [Tunturiibacter gelidoferens]|jgi:membrane fusion protein, heavy metal efflux system|uniref:Cobalt-zinc-cadmium efflux system membrane fusion protein n=1 Tax=Tunturiibacter gelidiferens TaxID=3069689 RepID=A0A9X0QE44_9BACT|nr:efflux RND transporter periplasmic adaptor subunit [Edaphobacter lichenicola]MBB5328741.1 cobalt-zinc-cadmium efflux system membrane fusion protein [Edaphobacter lichenicola]